MRRQLVRAIILVTGMTLVLLGFPLALVVSRYYENSAAVDLQRRAAEAAAETTLPVVAGELPELGDEDVAATFGLYDASGTLVAGVGPAQADAAASRALTGGPSFDHSTEFLVYAVPLNSRDSESVAGAVRVSEPDAAVDRRVHRAWLIMAAAGLGALVVAWAVAAAQARRLSRPISELAVSAERLGAGGLVLGQARTGVDELDILGEALASSSVRLAELIARERAFTADVSHQLRTPLTGLRLLIESQVDAPDVRDELTVEVNRLQSTVEHLLALNRDQAPATSTVSLDEIVVDAARRWAPRLAASGRHLAIDASRSIGLVSGSPTALSQILDVLIDNAATHGRGTIGVVVRSAPGGAALEVTDQGDGVRIEDSARIFERHHGSGNGIGLALGRSLVEADGGRLLLTQLSPPRFTVLLTSAGARSSDGGDGGRSAGEAMPDRANR